VCRAGGGGGGAEEQQRAPQRAPRRAAAHGGPGRGQRAQGQGGVQASWRQRRRCGCGGAMAALVWRMCKPGARTRAPRAPAMGGRCATPRARAQQGHARRPRTRGAAARRSRRGESVRASGRREHSEAAMRRRWRGRGEKASHTQRRRWLARASSRAAVARPATPPRAHTPPPPPRVAELLAAGWSTPALRRRQLRVQTASSGMCHGSAAPAQHRGYCRCDGGAACWCAAALSEPRLRAAAVALLRRLPRAALFAAGAAPRPPPSPPRPLRYLPPVPAARPLAWTSVMKVRGTATLLLADRI
jgi:hypothetical protein